MTRFVAVLIGVTLIAAGAAIGVWEGRQHFFRWVAGHPWSFWLGAITVFALLVAAESLFPVKRFALFPLPSRDPVNWMYSIAIAFRVLPFMSTAMFVVLPASLIIFLISRRA